MSLMLLLFAAVLVLVVLNVPIAVSLGIVVVAAMVTSHGLGILPNLAIVAYNGATSFPLPNLTYNDAGERLTATYPDGDIVTNAYGAQGWLNSVGTQAGTLMNGVGYTGIGGAAGLITGATLAPGSPSAYQYSATYDLLGGLPTSG